MNDRPENTAPSSPSPDLNSIPELAYLQSHGEDFSDMRAELETMLSRSPEQREAAPQTQPTPLSPNDRLPFDADGKIFETKPEQQTQQQTQPQPLDPGTKPVTQEQALDPYAPEGTQQKPVAEEAEPGEVMLDSEGKIRDAKTGRYVPHQAMQAERVRRKELEAALAQRNEEYARANERLQVLTEIMHGQEQAVKQAKQPEQEQQPVQEIDPEVDIFGWAKQQAERAQRAEQKLAEIESKASRQFGEMQTQQRFRSDVTAFAAKTPGFFDAYNHLVNVRRAELEALDFGDANAINNQIAIEEKILVQNEFQKNGSPGERLFKLAVAKGWKPAAPVVEATPAPAAPAAPALAPQQQPASQALQTNAAAAAAVKQIQNGIQASATLSGSGGTPGEGITVQQLADMSDDQFVELATKLGKKKLDHLLGGGR